MLKATRLGVSAFSFVFALTSGVAHAQTWSSIEDEYNKVKDALDGDAEHCETDTPAPPTGGTSTSPLPSEKKQPIAKVTYPSCANAMDWNAVDPSVEHPLAFDALKKECDLRSIPQVPNIKEIAGDMSKWGKVATEIDPFLKKLEDVQLTGAAEEDEQGQLKISVNKSTYINDVVARCYQKGTNGSGVFISSMPVIMPLGASEQTKDEHAYFGSCLMDLKCKKVDAATQQTDFKNCMNGLKILSGFAGQAQKLSQTQKEAACKIAVSVDSNKFDENDSKKSYLSKTPVDTARTYLAKKVQPVLDQRCAAAGQEGIGLERLTQACSDGGKGAKVTAVIFGKEWGDKAFCGSKLGNHELGFHAESCELSALCDENGKLDLASIKGNAPIKHHVLPDGKSTNEIALNAQGCRIEKYDWVQKNMKGQFEGGGCTGYLASFNYKEAPEAPSLAPSSQMCEYECYCRGPLNPKVASSGVAYCALK